MISKKTLYRWHKKLGLSLGFILFLLALSGIVITFRDELLPKLYPALTHVTPRGARVSIDQQLITARAALGENAITHLYTAERDDTANMVFFRPAGSWLPHMLTLDPYTNEVKGRMPLLQNIFGVMLYLHANLFLGKIGAGIVGIMGLLLIGFFITGVMIWWPADKLHADWALKAQGLRHGVRGVHRSVGLAFGLPLVFSAVTGFVLAFDLLQYAGPRKPEELLQIASCTFEEQLSALSLLTPEQLSNLVSIHMCSAKNGFMKFTHGLTERSGHEGYRRIVVDPRTKTILQTFDTSADPKNWSANQLFVYPLHTGEKFGIAGKIVNLLCGLALFALFITGLWPTLKRKLSSHR